MPETPASLSIGRLRWLVYLALVLGIITGLRLIYIQLFEHGKYTALAAGEHQRKDEIPAKRGQIYVLDGETKVPLALDQTLKLLYADPSIIADKADTAQKLANVTGGSAAAYLEAMDKGKEYAVLAGRINEETARRIKDLKLRGIGFKNQDYRSYPEGALASQVLGFVNNEGEGQYGIEGRLNEELKGTPGHLNAKTDTSGVPIATADNISKPPVDGADVVLTIDRNIQAKAEEYLKEGVEGSHAESGSIMVLDPDTGAVKAMANYPSFDPNAFGNVRDYRVFGNSVVSSQFEPGSVFKVITVAAGLDKGAIRPDTTYNDKVCEKIDGYEVCNAEKHGGEPNTTMTIALRNSLNTGMMQTLRLLGGNPDAITAVGKQAFYDYMTDHFAFGKPTGIEQVGEASGYVKPPTSSNVGYANMTFGQGVSVTMAQMVAAVGAIANGGKLYQPYVIDHKVKADGTTITTQPKVVNDKVMSSAAAKDLANMMEDVVQKGSGWRAITPGYRISGKTGTAQIPNPNGKGYLTDQNIGTFVGFAPTDNPKFVIMVRIDKPKNQAFAQTTTVPVFANLTRWLLQYYAIPPSS